MDAPPPRRSRLAWHLAGWGVAGGLLVAALQWVEYRWLVLAHSVEIYGALVAAVFAAVGIALGRRFTRARPEPVAPPATFVRDDARLRALAITPRELVILERIAEGLSNKEIAARLFVSENTVKTHASRLFDKLGARRRTQAVQQAREWRLIP